MTKRDGSPSRFSFWQIPCRLKFDCRFNRLIVHIDTQPETESLAYGPHLAILGEHGRNHSRNFLTPGDINTAAEEFSAQAHALELVANQHRQFGFVHAVQLT
jgi:hypothetical protein